MYVGADHRFFYNNNNNNKSLFHGVVVGVGGCVCVGDVAQARGLRRGGGGSVTVTRDCNDVHFSRRLAAPSFGGGRQIA